MELRTGEPAITKLLTINFTENKTACFLLGEFLSSNVEHENFLIINLEYHI